MRKRIKVLLMETDYFSGYFILNIQCCSNTLLPVTLFANSKNNITKYLEKRLHLEPFLITLIYVNNPRVSF